MVYLCITHFCYILAMQVGLWCLLVGDLQSRLVYGRMYINESTCCILSINVYNYTCSSPVLLYIVHYNIIVSSLLCILQVICHTQNLATQLSSPG